jgi:hypothetical protein
MNWKERIKKLKNIARFEKELERISLQIEEELQRERETLERSVRYQIDRACKKFLKGVGWALSTEPLPPAPANKLYLEPKFSSESSWVEKITVEIDPYEELVKVLPPPCLKREKTITIPFASFDEEKLFSHLEKFYEKILRLEEEEETTEEEVAEALSLGWYYSETDDEFQLAKIAEEDRLCHFYVIGATGTGKTKFLEFLIQQDIEKGNGFGVIDPHGDLVEDIKGFLACHFKKKGDEKEISERVVLVDPTDPDYTVTFNPIEKLPNVPIAEQVAELVSAFKKIWKDAWGVRMEDLMRNSLIALGEAELTLSELPPFLTRRDFRQAVLEKVDHPLVKEYFQRFDVLTDRGQVSWVEPVMNKVNALLSDQRIRQIFSSPKSSFNLREIMDQRKILLVKLDKGKLKDSSDLLGSLLLAKIQIATFSRSDLPYHKRVPFYLYVDEFQNFASDSFGILLSEARKYGLSLIIAHQTLAQIPEELRALILGNTGIQVYFRVNRHDAQLLAKEAFEYSGYEIKTVKNLHPVYWSLAEEWEHYTEELQNLPPRVCYAKHKIEGGLITLSTVDIQPAWEVLGMSEEEYQKYLASLPVGKKYLVPRSEILAIEKERAKILKEAKEKILVEREPTKPPPAKEPLPEKEKVIFPQVIPKEEEIPVYDHKEERQHKYLQNLIKRMAEEIGFKAVIEEATPEGGKVDVGLKRDSLKIACEISITSTNEQELSNIEKCLRAGYEKVILCSPERKTLEKVKSLFSQRFGEAEKEKVLFFLPEELFSYLQTLSLSKEERVKGYKVKVEYQPVEEEEEKLKREAIAQVVLQALQRLKGGK